MIKLVVALGNPGREYELTRHNIGWLAFDEFFSTRNIIWKKKFKGEYTSLSYNGEKVYFLKPQTYMNLSGESVLALCQFFKISLNEMLVVYDEIDLPMGSMALKKGGGFAGHNGLKSINKSTGRSDFLRLRLGVGRPSHGSVSSWVLSNFSYEENITLEKVLEAASQCIDVALDKGYEKAATLFSKKNYLEI